MKTLKNLKSSHDNPLVKILLALVLAVAGVAYANVTSGPINSLPKLDVVESNGQANRYSTDPQIATCVFDATGTTAATTSFTTFADATHFTCTALRGALVADSTTGFIQIARSGLYRVDVTCNGTGTTTNTMTEDAEISLDGGSTWTQVSGTATVGVALTGTLEESMHGDGYVSVSTANAGAALGQTVIAMRGKNSANTTTCAVGGGLRVERVDQAQPPAYP